MPSAAHLSDNVFVDAGDDRRLTIVAFAGGARLLLLRPYDFMDVTGVMRFNRILLRDPTKSWFHLGFGEPGGSFDSVVETVRAQLRALGGERVMTVGTSSGGYAALLAGHLLGADYVHAFSPQTYLDATNIARTGDVQLGRRANLKAVYAKLGTDAAYLDLRRVLSRPNGKTRYFIHVCAGHEQDCGRADYLEGIPQLTVLRYPCTMHNVLIGMSHKRFLRTVLTPDAQDTLLAQYKKLFGDAPVSSLGPRRKMDTALQEPLDRVGEIVAGVCRDRISFAEVMECRDLLARLALDSMNVLEIIVGLENEFGIEVDPETVTTEDFRTVASILAIVWAAADTDETVGEATEPEK
jgi:acyl carrier protein